MVQPTNQPRLGQPWLLVGPVMVHLAPINLGLVIPYTLNLVGPHDQCTKFVGVGRDDVAAPKSFPVVLWEISYERRWKMDN